MTSYFSLQDRAKRDNPLYEKRVSCAQCAILVFCSKPVAQGKSMLSCQKRSFLFSSRVSSTVHYEVEFVYFELECAYFEVE